MRFALPLLATVTLLAGCVAAPQGPSYSATYSSAAYASQKADLESARQTVARKRQELELAKLKEEADKLNAEIEELERRISQLEQQVAEAERARSVSAPSGQYRGKRGGCYTITKSGKRNYGGC